MSSITDRETVNIVVRKTQNGKTMEVYNRFHAVNDEELTIRLEGTGVAEYEIYLDGELSYKTNIDFTKKGDEAG